MSGYVLRILVPTVLALAATSPAAQPVKCIDAAGKVRYVDQGATSDTKCRPVESQINVVTPQNAPSSGARGGPASGGPGAPPKPGAAGELRAAQQARLAEAERRLDAAKKALAEQENVRVGGERNYARVQERLQPYQDAVEQEQRLVEQLRREAR